MKKSFLVFLIGILCLVMGVILGIQYEKKSLYSNIFKDLEPIRSSESSYKFIKPLLAYRIPSAEGQEEFQPLRNKISDFIDSEKMKGRINHASLFLSELDKGRWIGVNENEQHTPASLMKVVVMMAYFKNAETDKNVLSRKLTYSKSVDETRKSILFDGPSGLKLGISYSVDYLIEKMIIDSDNGALALLLDDIKQDSLDSLYQSLTVRYPTQNQYLISPRDYSLFFRVLYSATYLGEKMSEKALSLLAETTFKDGLVGDLPEDIRVAHKFGEHVINNGQVGGIELHDCGIIYYEPSPYFLCVMTSGNELGILQDFIKDISSLIYKEISKKSQL